MKLKTHSSPPVSVVRDPTCMVSDVAQRCLMKSEHRGLELVLNSNKELTMILKGPSTDATSSVVILMPVHDDLLDRVEAAQMTADEATWIAADLGRFDGTLYAVPKLDVLKSELGFPDEMIFQSEDLRELVRAHLQIVLGVSAVTAAYLSDRMGVSSSANTLTADNAIVIAPEPESASLPAAMTADELTATHN